MTTERWITVGTIGDIPCEGARVVRTSIGDIAIFRTAAGDIFAIDDCCPHLGGPLSQGIVHGRNVTCPLHSLVIDLATGSAVGPDEGCVLTIPVRLRDDEIELDLAAFAVKARTQKRNSRTKSGKAAA